MSDNAPSVEWRPELTRFWPTLLARRALPGCEPHNAALVELLLDMDGNREQLTTRYQNADLLAVDDAAIAWLRRGLDATIDRYFKRVGVAYPVHWNVQSWANVNRAGDYHAPHNHAWCYLSGTYYVQVPRVASSEDRSPGAISFYDPRPAASHSKLTGSTREATAFTVLPEAGTVWLWHASLNHLVHPNVAETPRISISFNVILEWSNRYASDE